MTTIAVSLQHSSFCSAPPPPEPTAGASRGTMHSQIAKARKSKRTYAAFHSAQAPP